MKNPIENKTVSNERENKEIAPDFLKIFNERLRNIQPVTNEEAKDWATLYDDPEITEVAKEVPAVLFDPNNLEWLAPPTDIFIEDPQNLDRGSHYIHEQVTEKLGKILGKSTMPYLLAGYILEGENGKRYLVLDDTRTEMVKSKLEEAEEFDQQKELAILDTLNKYK